MCAKTRICINFDFTTIESESVHEYSLVTFCWETYYPGSLVQTSLLEMTPVFTNSFSVFRSVYFFPSNIHQKLRSWIYRRYQYWLSLIQFTQYNKQNMCFNYLKVIFTFLIIYESSINYFRLINFPKVSIQKSS